MSTLMQSTWDTYNILTEVKRNAALPRSWVALRPYQKLVASRNIWTRLDRVGVLGQDDNAQGHSGCVNALHWSSDGSVLVSAGDDTRIHLWRLDTSQSSAEYPLGCIAKIHTGHTDNIFNAHILPGSPRIATCAADRQVRVFDVNRGSLSEYPGRLTEYNETQACIRILECHRGRVKRIVTENSSDYFLTVAEDGSVRQHDLRSPHKCSKRNGTCPPPLLKLPIELSTIALSSLTPWNFVVAGESPFAYLFDRRQTGRHLKEEWGVQCESDALTSCVRRFGRRRRNENERSGSEHVTGSRMSQDNGHELILCACAAYDLCRGVAAKYNDAFLAAYSADATYLYSTRDPPEERQKYELSALPPNKRRRLGSQSSDSEASKISAPLIHITDNHTDIEGDTDATMDTSQDSSVEEPANNTQDDEDSEHIPEYLRLPIVYPRKHYVGACNVETVKDVNFVGPRDDYIVSGSDDGNFFMWDKVTGELFDIHRGDGSVVNVIEQHPSLPVLAVSGLDHTVKIFAPTYGSSNSSRMSRSDEIIHNNLRQTSLLTSRRTRLSDVFLQYRRAWIGVGDLPEDAECVYQ